LTVADLRQRGVVKFLMQHGPASYFLQGGEQKGFEYELAESFGRALGVRVEVVTSPPGTDAITWLHDGKGDILAGLTTIEGAPPGPVITSRPYFETTAHVITKSDNLAPRILSELAGQPIALHTDSAYAYQLQLVQLATQTRALAPMLPAITGKEDVREILHGVVTGRTAATVLIDPIAHLAHAWYPGRLRTAWSLPRPVKLVWAVRPGQTELLRTIDEHLERVSRSGEKKILTEKYFLPPSVLRTASRAFEGSLSERGKLSRYDRIIARYAEEAGFDWRFVAALIFEESRFDHSRVSNAGASGLMQLMPLTAQLVGLKNLQDPHANIEAGVKYLSFLSRQFQEGRPRDRLALILASYVMGLGHVEDGQRIARLHGYDPDCWGESMEYMLPLLEDPEYHSKTLFGYGQGREAVRYANAILERYDIYSRYIERDFPSAEVPLPPDSQAASAVAG
jgi:membrane-bound lytic murein transglycosylase F